jgi:predicted phage-related endonuclease
VIAQAFSEEAGHPVYTPANPIEQHKTLPWMLCSLDRVTEVNGSGEVLECKAVRVDSDDWGAPGTDEVPGHYLLQCQHQLAVTGMKRANLAVLFGGVEFRAYVIDRDDDLIAKLERILSDFWGKVQRREPPAPNWEHPSTPELIEMVQKVEAGKVVQLEDALTSAVHEYTEAKYQKNSAAMREAKAKAELLHAMGDAEVANVSTGHVLKRALVKRGGYTVHDSEYYRFSIKEPA